MATPLKPMNPGCCCGATITCSRSTLVFHASFNGPATNNNQTIAYSYALTVGNQSFSGSGTYPYFAGGGGGSGGPIATYDYYLGLQNVVIPATGTVYGSGTITLGSGAGAVQHNYHFCVTCNSQDGSSASNPYEDDYNGGRTVNCPGDSYWSSTQTPRSLAAYPSTSHPARSLATVSTPLRVGFLAPCFLLGGAESWQLTLIESLSTLLGQLVQVVGCVVIDQADPTAVADLAALAPVTTGLTAARTLASQCDVIVTWTVLDYARLYAGLSAPPKTLFACHLPSTWGDGSAAMLASVDRLVAVSQYALSPIPASLANRATVVWNAVDPSRLAPTRTAAQVRTAWGVS